jgi:hypothetical protein
MNNYAWNTQVEAAPHWHSHLLNHSPHPPGSKGMLGVKIRTLTPLSTSPPLTQKDIWFQYFDGALGTYRTLRMVITTYEVQLLDVLANICEAHRTLSIADEDHTFHSIYKHLANILENHLKDEAFQFYQINPKSMLPRVFTNIKILLNDIYYEI